MDKNAQLITVIDVSHIELPIAGAEALQERDRLVAKSKEIVKIASQDDANLVAKGLKALKAFSNQCEEARRAAKGPFKAFVDRIDLLGHQLTDAVDMEAARFAKLHGAWQFEQNKLAEQARIEAFEKERKIREEAERVGREAQEAAAKKQRELEAAAANAKNAKAKAVAEAALKAAQAKAEADAAARVEKATVAIVETRQEALDTHNAVRSAGTGTRRDIKFEVEDAAALYKAFPYLVKLEPQAALIKAHLKQLQPGQTLPGVKHWEEASTYVR